MAMAVRKVLQATDPHGEGILRRKSNKVKVFDQALQRLVEDMFETMHASGGVGLAAPQVGALQRVIVVELPPEKDEDEGEDAPPRPGQRFTLCNPEITWRSPELQVGEEGCLSLAGWYAQVPRALGVEVRYQDLHGRRRKMSVEGYLARILQHEVDHLEGILFTDQVEDLSTLVRFREGEAEQVPLEQVPVARRK
jgi:peptide deformylase